MKGAKEKAVGLEYATMHNATHDALSSGPSRWGLNMLKLGKFDSPLHVKVSSYTAKMTLRKSGCVGVLLMFEGSFFLNRGHLESTHTGKIFPIVGKIVDIVSPA